MLIQFIPHVIMLLCLPCHDATQSLRQSSQRLLDAVFPEELQWDPRALQ